MSSRRLLTQAQQAAAVRYDPQSAALLELARQADLQRRQSISQAAVTASAAEQAAAGARPVVSGIFDQALARQTADRGMLAGDLAGLGGSADRIKAAAAAENARQQQQLAAAGAGALEDLVSRGQAAAAGRQASVRQAQAAYGQTVDKLGGEISALAGEQGAFTADTLNKLQNAQAGRAVTRRGQTLSHQDRQDAIRQRRDAATARKNAAAKKASAGLLPGGTKQVSVSQQVAVGDQISAAQGWITNLSQSEHTDSHSVRQLLLTGGSVQVPTGQTDSKGQEKMRSVAVPKFAKDIINTAYDIHTFGGVSPLNADRLHSRGVSLKRIGLKRLSAAQIVAAQVNQAAQQQGFS